MSRGAFAPSKRKGNICGGFNCKNERAPKSFLCPGCKQRMDEIRVSLDKEAETRTYNSRMVARRSQEDVPIEELLPSVAQPD